MRSSAIRRNNRASPVAPRGPWFARLPQGDSVPMVVALVIVAIVAAVVALMTMVVRIEGSDDSA
jgi:hypothetical protein